MDIWERETAEPSPCCAKSLPSFRLFKILWTMAHQAPLRIPPHGILQARIVEGVAMPFSRGYSDPGIQHTSPVSPALQADSLPLTHWGSPEFLAKSDLLGLVKDPHKVLKPLLPEGRNHHTRRQCYFPDCGHFFQC